nr:hypothetical protein GCM10020093_049000 [Planobispora longispora]
MFQFGQLLPELPAEENVALPLMLGGVSRGEAVRRARGWFGPLGLGGMEGRRPGELSGGQAQRVAIARALVTRPAVVFADEPTGALDQTTGHDTMRLLVEATRGNDASLVVVTHDPQVARWCDRTVEVRDGRVLPGTGRGMAAGPYSGHDVQGHSGHDVQGRPGHDGPGSLTRILPGGTDERAAGTELAAAARRRPPGLLGAGLTAVAVAVSTALLIFSVSANVAFQGRAEREAWRNPVAVGTAAVAVQAVHKDYVRDRTVTVVDLAVLKPGAAPPPGLDRLPAPGRSGSPRRWRNSPASSRPASSPAGSRRRSPGPSGTRRWSTPASWSRSAARRRTLRS